MAELEADMAGAAANLDYERAALIRDQIRELKSGAGIEKITTSKTPVRYPAKLRGRKTARA
jgi:excinuclease ABC subunit B